MAHATTLHALIGEGAARSPDAPAIEAPGRAVLSYAGLARHVDTVAAALRRAGIGRADRVALVLPNGPEAATAFLAVASAACCAPLNPNYVAQEFDFYLGDIGARALIVSAGMDSPARTVAQGRGIPILELVPATAAGCFSFAPDGSLAPDGGPLADGGSARAEDIALVLHTSGTTSRPKLVPLTQANLLASAGNVARTLALGPEDRCLNILPLFHIHGLVAALLASLAGGGAVICTPGFDVFKFFAWLESCRPSWYTAVPTMHQAILARAPGHGEILAAAALRFIRSSSAALPPQVLEGLERAFAAPVVEAYGMTEAAHQMASNPLPPLPRKPGTVGPAAGPEVAILAEDGGLLAPGAVGEVAIRGANVTHGYEHNEAANAEAFDGGWFRTGDQGVLDGEGYLTITGRLKEIINRGGEKIAPREVDEVLLDHPAVAQAVTFAVPHPGLGEEVGAAVVLAGEAGEAAGDAAGAGAGDTAARAALVRDIKAFAAGRLAFFKVPRHLVILAELPKGPTGKLQRIGLAERLGLVGVEAARTAADRTAPRDRLEATLATLWAEVLHLDSVGIHAQFLDLGGDSVLATQLLSRLRESLGVELTLADVFNTPTVADMAARIAEVLGPRGREGARDGAPGRRPGKGRARAEIAPRRGHGPAPLSYNQEWWLSLEAALPPGTAANRAASNRPSSLRLTGPLDVALLARSLTAVLRRHQVLRTVFGRARGRQVQRVLPASRLTLATTDLSGLPAADRVVEARRLAQASAAAPFDLTKGPLLRAHLLCLDEGDHVLVLIIHHAVFDGWSMAVLMRDLAAYYQALAGGRRVSLPALRVQYADFAVWQRAKLRGADFEATLAYWRARLSGDLQMPPLPADRPRPQVPSLRGGAARRLTAPALPARLKALSRAQGVTLYMTGLAAFQALIGAYSGARDIVTGCLVSGRGMRASEPLIGLFFNALALRTDLSGDPTVRALLARVRAVALGAFAHQEMPILRLTEALGVRPGPGQSPIPLVPVLFQMRNLPRAGALAETAAGALRIAEFKHGTGMARFDLTFDLAETEEGLLCTLDYNQDLFDATTAARMLEDFENLLAAFVADPGTPLSALPVSRLAGGRLAGGRPDGPEPGGTEPSGGAAP